MVVIPEHMRKNEKKILLILFIFALIMRFVYTNNDFSKNGTIGWKDSLYYLRHGEQFAKGNINAFAENMESYMVMGPVVPLIVFTDGHHRQHPGTYHHDCIPYLDDCGRSITVCSGEFV